MIQVAARVLSHQEMPIQSEDDVFLVRRQARTLAEQRGFDPFSMAALTTATSELGRNAFLHAGGGAVVLEELQDGDLVGIRLEFRDHGPGIADVERVMQGGYSTLKSLGLGLSGSRRLVNEFHIDTVVGQGTLITITKWKRL